MKTVTIVANGYILPVGSGHTSSWPGKVPKNQPIPTPKIVCSDGNESPFITATCLRGSLRRMSTEEFSDLIDEKIKTPEDFFFNMVGGGRTRKTGGNGNGNGKDDDSEGEPKKAEGSESSKKVYIEDLERARKANPILGLFGGSDVLGTFMPGHVIMGNAIPMEEPHIGVYKGSRSDDTNNRLGAVARVVDPEAFDKKIAEYQEMKEKRTETKNEVDKLEKKKRGTKKAPGSLTPEEEARLTKLRKAMEQDPTISVQQPLDGFEYTAPCKMKHRMVLQDVTEAEAGLFFKALDRLMRTDPYLGGHRARGFGEFRAEWAVKVIEKDGSRTEFKLAAEPFEGLDTDNRDALDRLTAALEAHVASETVTLAVPGSLRDPGMARAA